jgi:hypothetical protein
MPACSIVWIDCLLILFQSEFSITNEGQCNLFSSPVHEGYAKTYADESYGRIRDKNPTTGVSAGILFMIIFACLVGGFFACCILGTLVLEVLDYVFGYIERKRSFRARTNSFSTSLVTHL